MNDECKYSNKKWMDADASVNFRHKKNDTQIFRLPAKCDIIVSELVGFNRLMKTIWQPGWFSQGNGEDKPRLKPLKICLKITSFFWELAINSEVPPDPWLQIPGPPSCSKFMACNSQASPTSPVFAQKCQSLISVGIWSRDIPSKKIKERVLSDNNQNNQLLVCAFKPLQIWSCLVKTKVPVVSGDNCLFCCPLQQLDKFVLTAFGWMITTPTWSEWTWTIRIYQLEKQQLW